MSKVVNKSTSSHENIGTVRAIIKLLLMAVYLGTLMLWVLMPTNTYRQNWLPHLRAKFNFTTYFGVQGWYNLIINYKFKEVTVCNMSIRCFCRHSAFDLHVSYSLHCRNGLRVPSSWKQIER